MLHAVMVDFSCLHKLEIYVEHAYITSFNDNQQFTPQSHQLFIFLFLFLIHGQS